jgi:hypothetical protein
MALRRAGAEASFCAGLAALLLLLLLPATGRSDPGHVFLNNLGLFLVVLSAATWGGARIKYALLAGFAVAFPLLGLMSFWNDYRPAFERAIISRRQLAGVSFARESLPPLPHLSKLLPIDPWLNGLPRIPIGLPMGADEATERFFTLTGRAIPEYYIYPHSDLVEPGQLARKFADLERMACVYVPNYYLDLLNASDPANDAAVHAARDNAFLSGLLMFPVRLPAINPPFNPDAEIMERIARDYTLMRRCPAGVLLRRRNP